MLIVTEFIWNKRGNSFKISTKFFFRLDCFIYNYLKSSLDVYIELSSLVFSDTRGSLYLIAFPWTTLEEDYMFVVCYRPQIWTSLSVWFWCLLLAQLNRFWQNVVPLLKLSRPFIWIWCCAEYLIKILFLIHLGRPG
jgi:hypothetical protein